MCRPKMRATFPVVASASASSDDEFRGLGFPYAEEFGNMFQFFTEAADSYVGERDVDVARTLNPELQPLEDWIREHRDELKAWFGALGPNRR
jgi:hypothetical protein